MSTTVRLLTDDEVADLLSPRLAIDAIERIFLEVAEGRAMADQRIDRYMGTSWGDIAAMRGRTDEALVSDLQDVAQERHEGYVEANATTHEPYSLFKTMVGASTGLGVWALRINSEVLVGGETGAAVPGRLIKVPCGPGYSYTGLLMLFSSKTGELLGICPDGALQAMRVAATGLLGIRHACAVDEPVVGVLGTGGIARAHVKGLKEVRPGVAKVFVYSPSETHREQFAKDLAAETGLELIPVPSMTDFTSRRYDVVIEATNATVRLIEPDFLRPGCHVVITNSRTFDPACYKKATSAFITWNGGGAGWTIQNYIMPAGSEAVSIVHANPVSFAEFGLGTTELPEILAGRAKARNGPDDVTVHQNTSSSVQFAAVGAALLAEAEKRKAGKELPAAWFLQQRHS